MEEQPVKRGAEMHDQVMRRHQVNDKVSCKLRGNQQDGHPELASRLLPDKNKQNIAHENDPKTDRPSAKSQRKRDDFRDDDLIARWVKQLRHAFGFIDKQIIAGRQGFVKSNQQDGHKCAHNSAI